MCLGMVVILHLLYGIYNVSNGLDVFCLFWKHFFHSQGAPSNVRPRAQVLGYPSTAILLDMLISFQERVKLKYRRASTTDTVDMQVGKGTMGINTLPSYNNAILGI